jgi:hypothetical protein
MSVFIRFHRDFPSLGQSCIKKVLNFFVVAALFILVYDAADCFQLTLAWDPNSEPDIAGYILYYGTESETYPQQVDVGNYQGKALSSQAFVLDSSCSIFLGSSLFSLLAFRRNKV